MFVLWLDYLIWQLFGNVDTEHIIYVELIYFNNEFNSDVCFVIGLPYLAIISGMLDMEYIIYVWDPFFNMNSTVMFVLWLDYPIW